MKLLTTYPALELYPKKHYIKKRGGFEMMVYTAYARRRIDAFFTYLTVNDIPLASAADYMGINRTLFWRIHEGLRCPSLLFYLNMLKFSGQYNNTRDINYAYAYVKYPPQEIARRARRATLPYTHDTKPRHYGYGYISRALHVMDNTIIYAANYSPRRTPNSYYMLMNWIAHEERKANYSDMMRFYE